MKTINLNGEIHLEIEEHAFGTWPITIGLDGDGDAWPDRYDTFDLVVHSVNDAPTYTVPGTQTVAEDSPAFTVDITNISSGPENESDTELLAAVTSDPSKLQVTAIEKTDDTTYRLTIEPQSDAVGTASVFVDVTDQFDGRTLDNFNITLTPVNDAPVLATNSALECLPGETTTLTANNLHISDVDNPSDDTLVYRLNSTPSLLVTSLKVAHHWRLTEHLLKPISTMAPSPINTAVNKLVAIASTSASATESSPLKLVLFFLTLSWCRRRLTCRQYHHNRNVGT